MPPRDVRDYQVYLNGVLMALGRDYTIVGDPDIDSHPPMVKWTTGGIGDPLGPSDTVEMRYLDEPEPSAVDQLAEVTLPAEEVDRRRARRLVARSSQAIRRLIQTPVQLGISSRGVKP